MLKRKRINEEIVLVPTCSARTSLPCCGLVERHASNIASAPQGDRSACSSRASSIPNVAQLLETYSADRRWGTDDDRGR